MVRLNVPERDVLFTQGRLIEKELVKSLGRYVNWFLDVGSDEGGSVLASIVNLNWVPCCITQHPGTLRGVVKNASKVYYMVGF